METCEYSVELVDSEIVRNRSGAPVARTPGKLQRTVRVKLEEGGYVVIAWTDHEVMIERRENGVTEIHEGILRFISSNREVAQADQSASTAGT